MTKVLSADFAAFSRQYLAAHRTLNDISDPTSYSNVYWYGPVYHNLGMAIELAFKAVLLANEWSEDDIKSHNLRKLYEMIWPYMGDWKEFERTLGEESKKLNDLPSQLKARRVSDLKAQVGYHVFSMQLTVLNETYFAGLNGGSKFKTRYPSQSDTRRYAVNTSLLAMATERILDSFCRS